MSYCLKSNDGKIAGYIDSMHHAKAWQESLMNTTGILYLIESGYNPSNAIQQESKRLNDIMHAATLASAI